ncbi:hypothetical protein BV898_16998 [Hypsibius exemplaris]|uniref:Uncharacterized protein n=1 Tax=Hypsibius exemplaris TaxID=2072580 RepID=A0A9X6NH48_HYPEX|nr:hypothetical protein BV898_16998 [Hypsibius exemplaris]
MRGKPRTTELLHDNITTTTTQPATTTTSHNNYYTTPTNTAYTTHAHNNHYYNHAPQQPLLQPRPPLLR